MSIRTRLSKIEQASQPKRPPPPIEVHCLTREQDGWRYDNQRVSDADALAIARRRTHRNHFVIIRDDNDQALGHLADIQIQRSYV